MGEPEARKGPEDRWLGWKTGLRWGRGNRLASWPQAPPSSHPSRSPKLVPGRGSFLGRAEVQGAAHPACVVA